MILFKIKIKRERQGTSTHYEYPASYDASKVVFGPVYEPNVRGQGRPDQLCLVGVREQDAAAFGTGHGQTHGDHVFEVTEVSYDEALGFGNAWIKVYDRVVDQNKVTMILAKQARGVTLSAEELSALDPASSETGINRSKSFKEMLDAARKRF
jgi:hypothetical protein